MVTSTDAHIRVFRFSTGKLIREYDERVSVFEAAQRAGHLKIDAIDFGRRVAFEKELQVLVQCTLASGTLFTGSASGVCVCQWVSYFHLVVYEAQRM